MLALALILMSLCLRARPQLGGRLLQVRPRETPPAILPSVYPVLLGLWIIMRMASLILELTLLSAIILVSGLVLLDPATSWRVPPFLLLVKRAFPMARFSGMNSMLKLRVS